MEELPSYYEPEPSKIISTLSELYLYSYTHQYIKLKYINVLLRLQLKNGYGKIRSCEGHVLLERKNNQSEYLKVFLIPEEWDNLERSLRIERYVEHR